MDDRFTDHRRRWAGDATAWHRTPARAARAHGRCRSPCRDRRGRRATCCTSSTRSASSTSSRGRRRIRRTISRTRCRSRRARRSTPLSAVTRRSGRSTNSRRRSTTARSTSRSSPVPSACIRPAARERRTSISAGRLAGTRTSMSATRATAFAMPRRSTAPRSRRRIYPLFENALRAHYGRSDRGAPASDGTPVRALLRHRRLESSRVVPRSEAGTRDCDSFARQPLHRLPVHQVPAMRSWTWTRARR